MFLSFWRPSRQQTTIVKCLFMHHGQTRLRTPLERALHYKILRRDEILATAAALEHAFSVLYPVNAYHPPYLGTAIGRYPEDSYDGYATDQQAIPGFWPPQRLPNYTITWCVTGRYLARSLSIRSMHLFLISGQLALSSTLAPQSLTRYSRK